MKTCNKCGKEKPFSDFSIRKNRNNSFHPYCKICCSSRAKKWQSENKKRDKKSKAEYRIKNPEKVASWKRLITPEYKEACRRSTKEYRRKNPSKCAAHGAIKRTRKKMAMPAWANKSKIEKFYALARTLTLRTGIDHEVDHIIPIAGKMVCGLHVEFNLRVITAEENLIKRNKFSGE